MATSVYFISSFRVLRDSLARAISAESGVLSCAGGADTTSQAIADLQGDPPQVILLDMDDDPDNLLSNLETLKAACSAHILLLTRSQNMALLDVAIIAGARGVIDGKAPIDLLFTAITKVCEGQVWLDRAATARLFVELSRIKAETTSTGDIRTKLSSLSERERKIVTFVAHNMSAPGKTIAQKLNISESTLRNHLTAIYKKLEVDNRSGLIAFSYRHNLASHLK